ncbi:glycosyltransferase family 4 protein [Cyclobacterium xiamenense]|uniref:glycosyltransferase family 4 protein n=1 Tax=Cyclobacterium xiamenense TaxID=1297121 RepID=UPI0012B74B77|nr:glycosyltransferase family 4 protein [Cyclobacterium xiamenense]
MKLCYIHQYYLKPEEGGAIRSYHLAQGMAAAGVEVTVVTAHNRPDYEVRWDGKVQVHLLPVPYDNNFSAFRRLWAFAAFVRAAKKLLGRMPLPDLLYITSTPLSTGLIGTWARRKWGIPFVFEVRDLWPKAPIAIKSIRNSLLKKVLYKMEETIYRKAWKIVALSPGMQQYIQQKVSQQPVVLIPNFADLDFFQVRKDRYPNRQFDQQPLTFLYAGAIGEVNGLLQYLDLAEAAKRKGKNWLFQLMGKGKWLPALKEEAAKRGLSRVEFIPFGNKVEVRERMQAADIAYISFLRLRVLEVSSPNKFFDALAMGMPVLINFKGWINDLVSAHDLGWYQDEQPYEPLLEALEALEHCPEALARKGKNARSLAERSFAKDRAVASLLDVVEFCQNKDRTGLARFVSR